MEKQETARWECQVELSKYHEDIEPFRGREVEFHKLFDPYEVIKSEGNCLLNEGINNLWTLACGGTATSYNGTNARIGVGESTATANGTQTALQGTSTTYKAMEATYPTYGTSQKATFKSSFGGTDANIAWNEWSIDNGSAASKNLNRKVEALGTKASGTTWSLEVTVTIS